jgi:hypothetical protein
MKRPPGSCGVFSGFRRILADLPPGFPNDTNPFFLADLIRDIQKKASTGYFG